jgi:hypothetical protein
MIGEPGCSGAASAPENNTKAVGSTWAQNGAPPAISPGSDDGPVLVAASEKAESAVIVGADGSLGINHVAQVLSDWEEVDARPLSDGAAADTRYFPTERFAIDARPLTETDAFPFNGGMSPGGRPPSQVATDKESNCYNLEGPKLVIIFNHSEFSPHFGLGPRGGTEMDVKAITNTFQSLRWKVRVINDAKVQEIKAVVRDLQDSSKLCIWSLRWYISYNS